MVLGVHAEIANATLAAAEVMSAATPSTSSSGAQPIPLAAADPEQADLLQHVEASQQR